MKFYSLLRLFLLLLALSLYFTSYLHAQEPVAPKKDTLLIGLKMSPPFIQKNKSNHFEGISIWLWEKIAHDLNLEYKYVEQPLDSILVNLENKNLDLSIVPLTVTNKRTKNLDFTHPFFVSNSTIVKNKTSRISDVLKFVSTFFTFNFLKIILLLIITVFFFGFLVWLFERKGNEEFKGRSKGIWNGIWWSAVTMTTVGYGRHTPRSVGGRVVGLFWMFSAIMIISSFTASISSALTVNKLDWSAKSINDFKDKTTGTVDGSASLLFLKENFFSDVKGFENIDKGLMALQNEYIDIFIYDEPILKYTIRKNGLDKLEIIPLRFYLQFYAYGFSKGAHLELKDSISEKIIEITETNDWKILLSEFDVSML